jgi:hypothetical protein
LILILLFELSGMREERGKDQDQEQEQEQGQGLAASFEAGCLAMFRKHAFLRATRAP